MGNEPYHIDVWQLPQEMRSLTVDPTAKGALLLTVGNRPIVIVVAQDGTDRQRGWLEKTVWLSSWLVPAPWWKRWITRVHGFLQR